MHAVWMVPMAAMMLPSPTLLGSLSGAFEMLTTGMYDLARDGGIAELFNNTVSPDVALMGGYEWGSMDMSAHAAHGAGAVAAPKLAADAMSILGS